MRVKEWHDPREVQIAYPTDTIGDAAKIMARLYRAILPAGENDRLVGMITDRDIAVRAVALGKGPGTPRSPTSDERRGQYRFDQDDRRGPAQHGRVAAGLPVLNHEKRLVGIISLGDMASNGQAQLAGDALGGISRHGGQHSQTAH